MYFICKYLVWHTYDIYNSITGRRAYVIVLVRGTARQLRYGIIQYPGLFLKRVGNGNTKKEILSNDYIYTVHDATNVINLSCPAFLSIHQFSSSTQKCFTKKDGETSILRNTPLHIHGLFLVYRMFDNLRLYTLVPGTRRAGTHFQLFCSIVPVNHFHPAIHNSSTTPLSLRHRTLLFG